MQVLDLNNTELSQDTGTLYLGIKGVGADSEVEQKLLISASEIPQLLIYLSDALSAYSQNSQYKESK